MNRYPYFRLVVAVVLAWAGSERAGAAAFSQTFGVGLDLPDDASTGLSTSTALSLAEPRITGITVGLTISPTAGGTAFLGDLYAYLEHDGVVSVLVNRPGRAAGAPAGYDDNQSLSVTFSDAGADLHTYRPSPLIPAAGTVSGLWGPDGRRADPALVLTTDVRTAMLGGFEGQSANGVWTLFVADLSGGGTHRVDSWSLDLITVVPEPGVSAVATAAVLGGWAGWRRLGRFRQRRISC